MGLTRYAQSTNTSFQYFCDIFRKKLGMKLIFYMPLNIKVFFKLIILFLTSVNSHAQTTQNNKFAVSSKWLFYY